MSISRSSIGPEGRSTADLVKAIATDSATLIRKEIELAKLEMMEGLTARLHAAVALAAAGVLAFVAFIFAGLALADAIAGPLPDWAARLIVTAAFGLLAFIGLMKGKASLDAKPLVPEQTVRTVKEDVEWAKRQLKR